MVARQGCLGVVPGRALAVFNHSDCYLVTFTCAALCVFALVSVLHGWSSCWILPPLPVPAGTAVPALLFSQLIAITHCSLVSYKFQFSPVILSSEVFANLSVCKQRGHLDTCFMPFPECNRGFFKAPSVTFVGPCILGLSQQKKGSLVFFSKLSHKVAEKTPCYDEYQISISNL